MLYPHSNRLWPTQCGTTANVTTHFPHRAVRRVPLTHLSFQVDTRTSCGVNALSAVRKTQFYPVHTRKFATKTDCPEASPADAPGALCARHSRSPNSGATFVFAGCRRRPASSPLGKDGRRLCANLNIFACVYVWERVRLLLLCVQTNDDCDDDDDDLRSWAAFLVWLEKCMCMCYQPELIPYCILLHCSS